MGGRQGPRGCSEVTARCDGSFATGQEVYRPMKTRPMVSMAHVSRAFEKNRTLVVPLFRHKNLGPFPRPRIEFGQHSKPSL